MVHTLDNKEKLFSRKRLMRTAYRYVKILVESNLEELGSVRKICRFVADYLNLNEDTIRSNYNKSLKPRHKLHGKMILTSEEEVYLCSMVRYIEARRGKVPKESVILDTYY